jgi:hypothetical protein
MKQVIFDPGALFHQRDVVIHCYESKVFDYAGKVKISLCFNSVPRLKNESYV